MSSLPPTSPGPVTGVRPARPAWPMALGVIGTTLGILAGLQGCIGLFTPYFMKMMSRAMPQTVQPNPLAAIQEFGPEIVGLSVGVMLLGLLLLIGSAGLLQRKPWGVTVCLTWAVLKICFVIINSVTGYIIQAAHLETVAQDPNVPSFVAGPLMNAFALGGTIFGLLWGWAGPVFLLIWFTRSKVRAHVQSWREVEPADP